MYVVPGSGSRPRVFRTKADALAALSEGHMFEFVETDADNEYFLAYVHDRDGETRVMDMMTTDEGIAIKYFPDVTALRYDRYGSLVRWSRDLEEYKAFYERVQDSELRAASRIKEGRTERAFIEALDEAGRKLAYKRGGCVALDEMDELHMSYNSE
jgi:hypothetical protein